MANILNQDEIDSLLGAMERGEVDELEDKKDVDDSKIKEYNFRRPSLITKEKLRGLTNIHENFAREMAASLALFLRTSVEFNLVSTEQQQYSEFVNSLSTISYSIVFSAEPLPGLAVLETNLSLVFGIEDMLLGGQGDIETEIRKPTDIEVSIITPFIERIMEKLQDAWNSLMKVQLVQTRQEFDPEYIQAAPTDAPVVVMAFDAKIGLANGIINLCYPLPMIQSLIEFLDGGEGQMDSYYGKKADAETRRQIMESIMSVPLPLSVKLGGAQVRGKDLVGMRPGDVIILDKKIYDSVQVRIAGRSIYDARPGKVKDHLSVRLKNRISMKEDPEKNPILNINIT